MDDRKETITKTEARQGQQIKGMPIVLGCGILIAIALMAIVFGVFG